MYKRNRIAGDTEENAKKTAVMLLAYRENTERELFKKLTDRGYSKETATIAVQFVVEKKYLNEERYYIRLVEYYAHTKHYGRRKIMQEIRKKGFSDRVMSACEQEAFSSIDFAKECYAVLQGTHRQTSRQKMEAALSKRGFTTMNIRSAFNKFKEETGTEYGTKSEENDWDGTENEDGAFDDSDL